MHITNVDANTKEVTIANMWKLPLGYDIGPFKQEVEETAKILQQPTHAMKRKREYFDETLQGLITKDNKRVHAIMGDKAAPPPQ